MRRWNGSLRQRSRTCSWWRTPTPDKPTVTFEPPADPDGVNAQLIFRGEDCWQTYQLLSGRGAVFLTEPVDRGGEIRAFFRDLDGHLFEISELT